jgi:hypothetical protein
MCSTTHFRKTLNLLQRYSVGGRLDVSHVLSLSDEAMEKLALYLREKDFGKMRKWGKFFRTTSRS